MLNNKLKLAGGETVTVGQAKKHFSATWQHHKAQAWKVELGLTTDSVLEINAAINNMRDNNFDATYKRVLRKATATFVASF